MYASHLRSAWRGISWIACLLFLMSCTASTPQFRGVDVTGAPWGKDFQLTDHQGKTRTLADFRGKVVVLFFGYTHCPDVCPTTMADLAATMEKLGPQAKRVQVLFVTVDPERDTPALLSQYVPAFHPSFLGLWGGAEALKTVATDFRVVVNKQFKSLEKSTDYTVDHSAGSFIFDPQGRLRLFEPFGQGVEALAQDIRELLR